MAPVHICVYGCVRVCVCVFVMKYEVSSSVSRPLFVPRPHGRGPVGLAAKLSPGNTNDGQIERLK